MSFSVVTHSGRFHTDEVSAIALLELVFKEKATIYRTRDLELIEDLSASDNTFVVDVGHTYDPLKRRFDHHQEMMNLSFFDLIGKPQGSPGRFKIPVSSLGLVYHTYGRDLIKSFLPESDLSEDEMEKLYVSLYYRLCRDIDANDNGVAFADAGVKLNYKPNMSLISLVSSFNCEDHDSGIQDLAFRDAVDFVSLGFTAMLRAEIRGFLTKKRVRENLSDFMIYPEEAFRLIKGKNVSESSEAPLLVPPPLCKLMESLIVFREPLPSSKQIVNDIDRNHVRKFVICRKNENEWKITTRELPGRRTLIDLISERKAKEFFDDVNFIHKARFCGATRSLRTALKICELSLKAAKPWAYQ